MKPSTKDFTFNTPAKNNINLKQVKHDIIKFKLDHVKCLICFNLFTFFSLAQMYLKYYTNYIEFSFFSFSMYLHFNL